MRKDRILSGATKAVGLVLAASMVATPLVGCNKTKITNEGTPLVLATDALDKVFNPFFYTSGADGEVVGQTQIGMLTSNEKGELVAGWNEPCVAVDYSYYTTGTREKYAETGSYDDYFTDYYFAIKDDVKFSDGVLLTKDDVLFNIYMYLDPAYTGSSTMYSVDIQGLKAYRTQDDSEAGQDASDGYFNSKAEARINAIISWATNNVTGDWNDDAFAVYEDGAEIERGTIKKDIEKANEYFKDELNSDWVNASDAMEDYEKYVDRYGNKLVTEGWQVFLCRYNILKIVADQRNDDENRSIKNYKFEDAEIYTGEKTQEAVVTYVHNSFFGDAEDAPKSFKDHLVDVITGYATASTLQSYVLADVIRQELAGEMKVKSISGIEFLPQKQTSIQTSADGATRTLKDKNGETAAYDVLHIRINGVDPKAIQNFSFTVAPGHHYSNVWDERNGVDNFGVDFANPEFMEEVKKNAVPVGAGPYRPSTRNGSSATDSISLGSFCEDNVVYMERNDNFLLGAPKIRMLRFKVVYNNMLYDSVKRGEVHFASPSITGTIVNNQLEGTDKGKLSYTNADTLGYGYIGINAQYVPNIWVRRAIMCTLDPEFCSTYYGGGKYASVIYRPMSKTLVDYYPQDATAYYSEDNGYDVDYCIEQSGATLGGDDVLVVDGKKLKYTFTIAGDSTDHPAYQMLVHSAEILNAKGFDITVVNDSTALIKLAGGQLTVWAAAWSSSSDPDMYQVYHRYSTATSTRAWGYQYLTSAQCDAYQRGLVEDLSELIEQGREWTEPEDRVGYYHDALDTLMELAVEFPTYQRQTFYIWQTGVLNEDTMFTSTDSNNARRVTAYRSPLSEIWNVEFNEG